MTKSTITELQNNAKLCGMTLAEYEAVKKQHLDEITEMIAANNASNHNPYEGWTREEIRHFEDKFHKQPLVGTFTDAPITTTAEIDAEFERAFKGKTFEELFDD
jgi:hypothetical protein